MGERTKARRAARVKGCVLVLLMIGIVGGASAALFQNCGAGHEVIDEYIASIKDGAAVPATIGGAEAERITQVLRASHETSVDNWTMTGGTGCFFMSVDGADVNFLIEERSYGLEVVGIGIARDCSCPLPEENGQCHMD